MVTFVASFVIMLVVVGTLGGWANREQARRRGSHAGDHR